MTRHTLKAAWWVLAATAVALRALEVISEPTLWTVLGVVSAAVDGLDVRGGSRDATR